MKRTILAVLAAVAFVSGCSSAEAEPEPTLWQTYGDRLTDLKRDDCANLTTLSVDCSQSTDARIALTSEVAKSLLSSDPKTDEINAAYVAAGYVHAAHQKYLDLTCPQFQSFTQLNQCGRYAWEVSDEFDAFVAKVAATEGST